MANYKRKKISTILKYLPLIILAVIVLFPIILMIANSFMDKGEILSAYGSMSSNTAVNSGFMKFKFIPELVTLKQYYTVLFRKPNFLVMFWNSVILVLPIVIGQVVISTPAAYAFAKIRFPLRDQMFYLIIVLMLMPYQVTIVPNYIILKKIGLLGSRTAVILPGVFSALGVFLLRQFMRSIPDEQCDAAKIDGASYFGVFSKIILPQCKSGVISLAMLSFVDSWNMVEQPLIFLENGNMHPLSIFLSNINYSELGVAFACGVIFMVPAILLFLNCEKDLLKGIQHLEIK